ncbi:MAG: hypothetical protein ACK5NF_06945 [Bacilli bacterium]
MNNQNYMIPANTKKGGLILSMFRPIDLGILLTGIGISLLFLIILQTTEITATIIILTPAFIAGFLVFPVAYYHNVRILSIQLFKFLTERQRFIWRGWCTRDE